MIRTAFSFKGEIDRKGFALGSGLAFVVMMVIGVSVFTPIYFALAWSAKMGALSPELFEAAKTLPASCVVIAVGLPYIWVGAALAARRIRAIGLNPLIVLPLWLLFDLVDFYALQPLTDVRSVWPLSSMTPIGGVLTTAALLVMLAVPSRDKSSAATGFQASAKALHRRSAKHLRTTELTS